MDWKKVKAFVVNLDLYIAAVCLAVLVLVTFLGVVMRYVFRHPFVWEEEIQIGMFLWVSFFGGIACFRKKQHVSITSLYDKLSRKGKIVDTLVVAVITVATLFYLFLKSMDMVMMFARTNKTTSVLSIPCSFLYGIIPLCCLLMIVNYVVVMIPDVKKLIEKKEDEHK